MSNFKQETIEKIGGREIDEFYFAYEPDVYLDEETKARVRAEAIYSGKGKIDWGLMKAKFCLEELHPELTGDDVFDYDDSYGQQFYFGWVTFKDSNQWIERKEYDGSEWWEQCKKPSLL